MINQCVLEKHITWPTVAKLSSLQCRQILAARVDIQYPLRHSHMAAKHSGDECNVALLSCVADMSNTFRLIVWGHVCHIGHNCNGTDNGSKCPAVARGGGGGVGHRWNWLMHKRLKQAVKRNSLEPFSKELKVVVFYSIKTVVSQLEELLINWSTFSFSKTRDHRIAWFLCFKKDSPKSLRVRDFPDNQHHGDSLSSPAPWIYFTFTIDSGVHNGHNGNFRSDSACFLRKLYRHANLDWIVGRFCCLISTFTCSLWALLCIICTMF